MANQLANQEEMLAEFRAQLEPVNAGLEVNPDDNELLAIKEDILSQISELEQEIKKLKSEAAAKPLKKASPQPEKWSKENHPAFQAGYRRPGAPQAQAEEATPKPFQVNDEVMAKWISGDKAFYPARITSITGSSADPIYYVTFKGYNTTETLKGSEIRTVQKESKKRKADGSLVGPSVPAAATAANVISAAANINPALANQVRREPSKVSDGPPRPAKIPRKVKANKAYEDSKSNWQNFSANTKVGKALGKKESMFRTGSSVTARVGFTGSGQAMRKDPTRARHVYEALEDE